MSGGAWQRSGYGGARQRRRHRNFSCTPRPRCSAPTQQSQLTHTVPPLCKYQCKRSAPQPASSSAPLRRRRVPTTPVPLLPVLPPRPWRPTTPAAARPRPRPSSWTTSPRARSRSCRRRAATAVSWFFFPCARSGGDAALSPRPPAAPQPRPEPKLAGSNRLPPLPAPTRPPVEEKTDAP